MSELIQVINFNGHMFNRVESYQGWENRDGTYDNLDDAKARGIEILKNERKKINSRIKEIERIESVDQIMKSSSLDCHFNE